MVGVAAIKRTVSEASRFAVALFAVLGAASLAVWVVDVVTSKHHRPFTFWAVVTLGLLLVAALLWGWRRRSRPGADGHAVTIAHVEHFHQGDPQNLSGATSASAPAPGPRRQTPKFTKFENQTIRLGDLVESDSPVLESVAFEGCELHGPAMLAIMGAFTMIHCDIPIAGANSFWEFDPALPQATGAIGVLNCSFVRCKLSNVGFAGSPEVIQYIKELAGC